MCIRDLVGNWRHTMDTRPEFVRAGKLLSLEASYERAPEKSTSIRAVRSVASTTRMPQAVGTSHGTWRFTMDETPKLLRAASFPSVQARYRRRRAAALDDT